MTHQRRLSLALGLVAVAVLGATATGGFSSASAERDLQVDVVADDEAYLGVALANESGDLEVTLTNRFAESLTAVEVTAGNRSRTLVDANRTELGVGESVTFVFGDVDCERVGVSATGESTKVTLARDCP